MISECIFNCNFDLDESNKTDNFPIFPGREAEYLRTNNAYMNYKCRGK